LASTTPSPHLALVQSGRQAFGSKEFLPPVSHCSFPSFKLFPHTADRSIGAAEDDSLEENSEFSAEDTMEDATADETADETMETAELEEELFNEPDALEAETEEIVAPLADETGLDKELDAWHAGRTFHLHPPLQESGSDSEQVGTVQVLPHCTSR
jgi:hypothetical protein